MTDTALQDRVAELEALVRDQAAELQGAHADAVVLEQERDDALDALTRLGDRMRGVLERLDEALERRGEG